MAKVVSYGWNRRRSAEVSRQQAEADRMDKGYEVRKEQLFNGTKTFVEILRENRGSKGEQVSKKFGQKETERDSMKELTMFWSGHQREEHWLRRCAVGVLKTFSKVDSVNDRLESRGFKFTSHFVGTKSVLWCFESEIDKEGSLITGWVIGEPLLVDEDTALRKRLDKGRILVLVSQEEIVSAKVRVEVGKGSFLVRVKEESVEVDGQWIEKYLGLKKDDLEALQKSSDVNSWREEYDREAIGEKLGLSGQFRTGECEAQEKARGWFKRRQNKGGKAANRKNWEADQPSSDASEEESGSPTIPRRSMHEKGKYGERGECSKPDQLRKDESVLGGLDNRETNIGPQNYSRSPSLEGPLKEHLDKVDKEVGLAEKVGDKGQ
ncbi:hypothetical protein Q3G72_033291 [Acer saccharum]|nr:hypothetical protein Q3G72_033291 [Acer saccharum]